MTKREDIWLLFGKKLAGEATEKELVRLEALLKQYPEITFSLQLLIDNWAAAHPKEEERTAQAFLRHMQRMEKKFYQQSHATPVHSYRYQHKPLSDWRRFWFNLFFKKKHH
jgi:hypothetical protein